MRSLSNRHRSWWAFTIIFAMATALVGSQITQAQPPAPAAKYTIYLPRVIGSAKTSPIDPAPVRFVNDLGRATHAAIGPEGGTLNATAADGTRFQLEVPAEALDFAEVITMTPVLRAENLPLSGGLIGAVNLEPAGLELYAPATLRIIPSKLAPNLMTIGFAYNGTGEQFHLHPLAPAGNLQTQAEQIKITMEIVSIRPVGAGRGSRADVERQVAQPAPSDPIDAMEDDLVAEALDLLEKEVSRRAWVQDVHPLLLQALTDDQVVDAAIRRFDSWLQLVDSHGDRPRFFTQITEGRELIGRIIPRASAAAAERCYSQKRPEEGFRLLRWMRYARKYLGSAEVAAIQAKLSKCLRFELTFYSHMTEGGYGDPYGYLYELQAKVTLRAASGMNATGAGPLEWQHVSWIGRASACTISVIGVDSTFDAQKPSFGLNITPVSRTSPAVNITLRYHPGTPGEQTTIQCPGGGGAGASTQAWATYFGQTHANERDGAGYRVTAQAVGAGSFPGWIYPHLTTSGPSGQAVIEATVIELVHAPER
jgi:hypothetical protein